MAGGQSPVESVVSTAFNNFYAGKRVLVTGHTGFKGGWLSLWLSKLGAKVGGISLEAPTNPNFYETISPGVFAGEQECDIRDLKALTLGIKQMKPDIIFHMAAQSLVRRSFANPVETFGTNALGTAHLLEAVRCNELSCPVIVITTDKCYENQGWEHGYRETDPLGGHDVYSMSKAAAELVVQSWRKSFFLPDPKLGNLASVRAGNVIGGGDYAGDRIVPDCIRALQAGQPIPVRNPSATRPWQHVLDCVSGYLWLGACLTGAEKQTPLASAFNFGPGADSNLPVRELVDEILKIWPGRWQQISEPNAPHEAAKLNLDISKAAELLQWFPVWSFKEAIQETIVWYHERHVKKNPDMLNFSLAQIDAFTTFAAARQIQWAQPA
jgi:CDP-glucose 4,6-dehydratase